MFYPDKVLSAMRFRLAISWVILTTLMGCGHDQDHFYKLRADAERNGEFQRGWLPDFLPRSSHDIHLIYDISPSREWCGFEFNPSDAGEFIRSLKPVDPRAPGIRNVTGPSARWWPKFLQGDVNSLRNDEAAEAGFSLFSVTRPASEAESETLLFAINPKDGRAYFYGH